MKASPKDPARKPDGILLEASELARRTELGARSPGAGRLPILISVQLFARIGNGEQPEQVNKPGVLVVLIRTGILFVVSDGSISYVDRLKC